MSAETTASPLLLELKGGYAVMTLNRPEKRNALSSELLATLQDAMEEIKGRCSVVVLTGAGDRAFCAGMDLAEAKEKAATAEREFAHGSHAFFEVLEAMRRHPAVFIAAVNGFALGGGLTLTHNSELAIAADTATFGMPELGFGAFPGLAGPATIHRVLPKNAAWMILTAGQVDAETALRFGIVNEVVAPEALLARAEELAERLAGFDPVVLDYAKKALRDIPLLDWTRSIEYGLNLGHVIARQSEAAEEGLSRFVEGERSAGQGARPA